MFVTPSAVSFIGKYSVTLMIQRIVHATTKKIVYTIHGISSDGVPCKEKKPKEILMFLICTVSL